MFVHRQRHRIAAKAFDAHKTLGSVHQLFQVFHPVLPFALRAVVLDQAAVVEHQLDDLAQGAALGLLAHHVDLGGKGADGSARATRHTADRIVQRAARRARHVLQQLDAARANTARREVHHPHEAGVVVRVLQQAQIRQRMFDLGALEKAQTAVHAVRHAGVEQRCLHHPALRV